MVLLVIIGLLSGVGIFGRRSSTAMRVLATTCLAIAIGVAVVTTETALNLNRTSFAFAIEHPDCLGGRYACVASSEHAALENQFLMDWIDAASCRARCLVLDIHH